MSIFTLTEISKFFAKIDQIFPEDIASYEKELRNILDRHNVPPSMVSGRCYYYEPARILTVRVVQQLKRSGANRLLITHVVSWLLRDVAPMGNFEGLVMRSSSKAAKKPVILVETMRAHQHVCRISDVGEVEDEDGGWVRAFPTLSIPVHRYAKSINDLVTLRNLEISEGGEA